ncbi:MAG: hypothetical protein M9919_10725 [Burkholderiaceae bacterium]|nr:hypothetical protein [Burkholderiaceae bacterium]
MTPEAKARKTIDARLLSAGWHVCGVADANIHAAVGVAIREFPLNPGFGYADYLLYVNGKACCVIEAKKEGAITNFRRAQTLQRSGLAKGLLTSHGYSTTSEGKYGFANIHRSPDLPGPPPVPSAVLSARVRLES